jgi:hypothetical protein
LDLSGIGLFTGGDNMELRSFACFGISGGQQLWCISGPVVIGLFEFMPLREGVLDLRFKIVLEALVGFWVVLSK